MAVISPETNNIVVGQRKSYKWIGVTEADTFGSAEIMGGRYTITVEGDVAGGHIDIGYNHSGDAEDYIALDTTNLRFNSAGTYNVELAEGFIKPLPTGGSSRDVSIFLSAIPMEDR